MLVASIIATLIHDFFQVSWLKRHGDVPHLLTYGMTTYSNDARYQVYHEQPNDWKLQVQFPQLSDQGIYECMVPASPAPIYRRTRLTVVGELDHLRIHDYKWINSKGLSQKYSD